MRIIVGLFALIVISLNAGSSFAQELPIRPSRTIPFETDEGSYMNVDVSPDGRFLAFDLLGDLYTVPVVGGNATQLTRGIALHVRPVWSPDGKMLAYLGDVSGDFHLNVMDVAGKFLTIPDSAGLTTWFGANAIWTPDSRYIVINGRTFGLMGGMSYIAVGVKDIVRFSEDGKVIYGIDSGRLVRYEPSTGGKNYIFPILRGQTNGILSQDVRWWCYIADSDKRRSLVLQDLSNGKSRVLVTSLLQGDYRYQPNVPPPHFAFSPDSKYVYIGYGGKIHQIGTETGSNKIIPFVAHVRSDLGPFDYHRFRISDDSIKVKYTRCASTSPDGSHLVFSALDRVYIKDMPGGVPRILASQQCSQFQPAFSPDGKWIAYVSWCDTIGGYLWQAPATRGKPVQLTQVAGQYQRPVWSPDGTLIAVVRGIPKLGDRDDPGIGTLMLVSVNGGAERLIADSVPLLNSLAFSNDGKRLIYTPKSLQGSSSSSVPELMSQDMENGGTRVEAVGSADTYYNDKKISPDGRFLVYSLDEDLYLMPINKMSRPIVLPDGKHPLTAIKFAAGVDAHWEKGGKMLGWCYSNHYYVVDPNKILAAAAKKADVRNKDSVSRNNLIEVSMRPDTDVPLNMKVMLNRSHGILALRNVRIITMQGDRVIQHGTIVLKNGRILSVGPGRIVKIPAGAKIMDMTGATVMPGLIDVHLHMRVPSNIFPQQSWMFLINLAYGVTTARDPSLSFDSYGYKELLQTGQMLGPRLFTVGRAVRIPDGVVRMDSEDDAVSVVEKRHRMGGSVVKQYSLPKRIQRQWLLLACRKFGLNMTNEGAFDPILQVGMIKDGSTGVEHNPVWGDVYDDVISFVARSGVFFTPTLQVAYGTEEAKEYFKYKYWKHPDSKLMHFALSDTSQHRPTGNGAESVETISNSHPRDTLNPGFLSPARIDTRILRKGGRIAVGSHGNDEGIGVHNEIWALCMGGFSRMEALRAATMVGAEALGVRVDLGSIEVGKIADLLILNRNPLDDIHYTKDIRYVMKAGTLYDGNTLYEIWPVRKKCPDWKLGGNPN